jgi:hypothetical protein
MLSSDGEKLLVSKQLSILVQEQPLESRELSSNFIVSSVVIIWNNHLIFMSFLDSISKTCNYSNMPWKKLNP